MSNAKVIKVAAERVYQLRPYESVRLSIEVEVPDTKLSDDLALRTTYMECVQRMDNSFSDIVNHYNNNQNR